MMLLLLMMFLSPPWGRAGLQMLGCIDYYSTNNKGMRGKLNEPLARWLLCQCMELASQWLGRCTSQPLVGSSDSCIKLM
jgi:hypothetical protein